jgi:hypothetical protein
MGSWIIALARYWCKLKGKSYKNSLQITEQNLSLTSLVQENLWKRGHELIVLPQE